MLRIVSACALSAALLAACSPANFESEPVAVQTPNGTVTCQLYTRGMTDWDRSISRPDTMSVEVADSFCRREGQRLQGAA
ncbi:hypothetical protein [Paracoccus sp. ME4]|uniref:hypothetical protein n=1 Tax=Paracoccus sp. ME4 TaxID=3138066 RepID=UPI00398B6345